MSEFLFTLLLVGVPIIAAGIVAAIIYWIFREMQ